MFVGRDEFLWGNLLNVLDKVLGLCMSMDFFCRIPAYLCPATLYDVHSCIYEYIYIYAYVKCLAGDGVTMFTLQLLAASLDQS